MRCWAIGALLSVLVGSVGSAQDVEPRAAADAPSDYRASSVWVPPPAPPSPEQEPAPPTPDDEPAPIGPFIGLGAGLGAAFGLAGALTVARDRTFDSNIPPLVLLPATGAVGGIYAGLFVASLYYAFEAEPFPLPWAIFEVVLGALSVGHATVALLQGETADDEDEIALNLVTGAWFVGHAIWSFAVAE